MHVLSRKKNIFLLTGSFAVCIILIFCFQGILDFFHQAIPILYPSMADITVTIDESDRGLQHKQIKELEKLNEISTVYGNKECTDFLVDGENIGYKVLSFDEQQFKEIGLHKTIYNWLITDKWGLQWQWLLTLIVFNALLCASSIILSIIYPLKKIEQTSIIELIANN
ncbi:hypothetical protein [Tepidimicrobium xylanilyticum]|uniref:Uncharacterized protein n=1 Tax=Tepidimicrobium xylanilyticum TaxID=1123352 RepID=A0A1H3DNV9_9FIRM|nr:hypothetical protein [Tepidimicrobium xylanilyticum]SDX68030.1 hypothetical protein SAMN05660923_02719 [Tepidimicrobium xylanilyticum]